MKATQQLHDLGQSLWLDNITRDLLDGGTLGLAAQGQILELSRAVLAGGSAGAAWKAELLAADVGEPPRIELGDGHRLECGDGGVGLRGRRDPDSMRIRNPYDVKSPVLQHPWESPATIADR